jgi:DNA polymerase-3 subunit beta
MKFSIEKSTFASGLQQVLSVVEQRAIMPILGNVLLECGGGKISLTAVNLDISIHCSAKADVELDGKITLPAKKLGAVVRSLPGNEVRVESENMRVKISSERSNFQMMGLPADDFPVANDPNQSNKITLKQSEMLRMLKSVSFAQSSDDNRYILNGVYFCFEPGKLTFAATDGRRLSLNSKIMENVETAQNGVIVPSKTVREVERLLGQGDDVSFAFDDKQVEFSIAVKKDNRDGLVDDIKIISKIIEGSYPNFRQIVPQTTESRIRVDRQLLLECIQRVAIVASEQRNLVRLKFGSNFLEVSAESQEYGSANERIAIAYDGNPAEIAFNHIFLCDPLKVLPQDEVFFEFKDELSAGVFKTLDHFLYVVMPLRVGQ